LIACFLTNISAKYYENPTMLSRVIAKNIGDVFFETQCSYSTKPKHHRAINRFNENNAVITIVDKRKYQDTEPST